MVADVEACCCSGELAVCLWRASQEPQSTRLRSLVGCGTCLHATTTRHMHLGIAFGLDDDIDRQKSRTVSLRKLTIKEMSDELYDNL